MTLTHNVENSTVWNNQLTINTNYTIPAIYNCVVTVDVNGRSSISYSLLSNNTPSDIDFFLIHVLLAFSDLFKNKLFKNEMSSEVDDEIKILDQ